MENTGFAAKADLQYRGQGAAQAFEDAAVMGNLFARIQTKGDIPQILSKFERIRKPRTKFFVDRSRSMQEIYTMGDGPAQEARDHQLLHEEPFDGYPNPLSDPVLKKLIFDFDAEDSIEALQGEVAQDN